MKVISKKKIISIMILAIFVLVFLWISPVLFQEGNPVPVLKGIMKLNSNKDKIFSISGNPQRYISKSIEGDIPMISLLKKEGWRFDEQFGAGYIFSKGDSKLVIKSVQYTGKYTIWKFPIK